METRRVYIRTFGCQMNVHDSEQAMTLLAEHGYRGVTAADQADLILVNTCSIREKAAQKIFSELGRYADLKRHHPDLKITVMGCLAQQWGDRLRNRAPCVDAVLGTHQIHRLPEILRRIENGTESVCATDFLPLAPSIGIHAISAPESLSAFVTIMQGCDNYCAYCVVPYVRGREQSRPPEDILKEIAWLAEQGVCEVTLLGQNVNAYGRTLGKGTDFPALIRDVAAIDGIERIRFTTSHPKDLSRELIGCFGTVAKLCEHIHLPVQAGSDRVLRGMNRGYSAAEYEERIARLRTACPEVAISSDVIVGFPGERETDFEETIDMVKKIRFDSLFSFMYSEREGTEAAGLPDPVPDAVKQRRLRVLQDVQNTVTLEKHQAMVGRCFEVLVEGPSKRGRGEWMGRTRTNAIVHFPGKGVHRGQILSVTVHEAYSHSLRGEWVSWEERKTE